jgi:hypothetical protein
MTDAPMDSRDVKRNVLEGLESAADWHEEAARYAWQKQQLQHEEAAQELRALLGMVKAMPAEDKRLGEMAAICIRTECRCCRIDRDFFGDIGFFAAYQTAEQLLDALLVKYRRIDRAESEARDNPC